MKCPSCNIMLVSADRHGIDIDYCPCCWGIWLDKGELNLILERSQAPARGVADETAPVTAAGMWSQPHSTTELTAWR